MVSITSYRRQSMKTSTKSGCRVSREQGAIRCKDFSSQDLERCIDLASGPGYVLKAQLQKEFLLAAQGS
jgi:hypothetical protein